MDGSWMRCGGAERADAVELRNNLYIRPGSLVEKEDWRVSFEVGWWFCLVWFGLVGKRARLFFWLFEKYSKTEVASRERGTSDGGWSTMVMRVGV